jgi:hypothetical protein
VIVSSYSSSSSGCSSCSAALSQAQAAISGMSMGSGSGSGSGALGMWDKLWFHWMRPKYGLSVIGPVHWCAFNPFLSQNVSDEKRERQTPGLRVLSRPMVHSFPEFLNLTPNDLGNGAPETSVERIWRALRNKSRLCVLCPKGHTFLYSTISMKRRF